MLGKMTAAVSSEAGVVVSKVPIPRPAPEQVLVRVHAAGLNRADLLAARGGYGASAPGTPIGMDWAGEVVELGSDVSALQLGQFVACSGAGGCAEYALADKARVFPFDPAQVSIHTAAALPLALMTAHNALITVGRMSTGDAVLINGGSSGVGLAAIKIARLLGAGFVAATSASPEKRERLRSWGADLVIDTSMDQWSDKVLEATARRGVDVVVDMVTGSTVNETMAASAVVGRIVNVGRLGGERVDLDLDLHSRKRLSIIGVTFRTRTLSEIREIVACSRSTLWPLVESGKLSLPIDRCFRLEEAASAHALMASNGHFGKILVSPLAADACAVPRSPTGS